VALWIFDRDVIGSGGNNIGYKISNNGISEEISAKTVKTKFNFNFSDLAPAVSDFIPTRLISLNNETIYWQELPQKKTREEFLRTLYDIILTKDEIISKFFEVDGLMTRRVSCEFLKLRKKEIEKKYYREIQRYFVGVWPQIPFKLPTKSINTILELFCITSFLVFPFPKDIAIIVARYIIYHSLFCG